MPQTSQFERERAKRLCAAITSSRMGTSYQTEYRRIGEGAIDEIYYRAAAAINEALNETIEAFVKEAMKPERIH